MDFSYLLNILLKRKWLLISVVLLSSVATWFFVGKLPPVYKSSAIISTGIIETKSLNLKQDNGFIQKFQIESSFNGLTEKMKSRSSLKVLSERLLMHDLQADGLKTKPFRTPEPDEEKGVSQTELADYAVKLKTSYVDSLVNTNPRTEPSNNRIADAFKYDYESLFKKLEVKRIGETDYLSVEFESESPELSYFVVKTYLRDFLELYDKDISSEEDKSLIFHEDLTKKKKEELDNKTNEINNYKRVNGLLDVSTQRESVVAHLKELEFKKEEQSQQVMAFSRKIPILEAKILEYNKFNTDVYQKGFLNNGEFQRLDADIKSLSKKLVDQVAAGNKNTAALEGKIENLKEQQSKLIEKSVPTFDQKTQQTISGQLRDWIMELLEMRLELEFAKTAEASYAAEINKNSGRAGKLLNDDSHLRTLEAEQNRLELEYLRSTEELDKAKKFAEGTENPLSIIEPAELPDEPESSHRTVFSVFAGVASGTMASIVLFLLALVDTSLQSPSQFQRTTKLPLLGFINKVKVRQMNLKDLFTHTQSDKDLEIFKENIRKIRTALEASGSKSFLFISPKEQEGKSFLTMLLAYSLSLSNKRILIIDTNFKNNTLSGFKTKSFIEITTGEPLGVGASSNTKAVTVTEEGDPQVKLIDIVGNKGGSQSPSEVLAGKDFKKILQGYEKKYDYIFLEAAAMNKYSDARELIPYVEKVVAIFSSQVPIGNADKETIAYLQSLNGQMLGGILNNVDLKNV